MKRVLLLIFTSILMANNILGQIQTNVYLTGDFNSWGADPMTYRDLGVDNWIFTTQYTGSTQILYFKFRQAPDNWDQTWGRGDAVSLDSKTIWYNNGANGHLSFTENKFYTYIFKDVANGNNSEGTVIETSSIPVSVFSTYRVPQTVYAYQKPLVYAVLTGSLPDGQSVYVRYTTDDFVNSTITELALFSGNTYRAELNFVESGTVTYYIFTSGAGLTITPSDADIYTINYLNNGGSNYSYTIQSGTVAFSNADGTSNWGQTTTWESGSLPSSTDNVVIQHNVVLNQNSTVGSILVNKDVSFDVNSTSELTITNDLSNNGAITIKSDATNTGSVKITGNSEGSYTVERYITNYNDNNDGWHLISSPVSGFAIAGSDFAPVSGDDDLYEFDETVNVENWLNYNGGTFGDTDFGVGKGYLAAYKTAATKEFSGSITTGSVQKNLSWTDGALYEGLNLLGNPYTSAIDWALISKTASVGGSVYVLNSSTNQYIDWNGSIGDLTDGIIPSMQGFFIYTSAAGQSITMESGDQVHQTSPYYKNTTNLADNTMKISVIGSEGSSNAYIQFRDDATIDFDLTCDAFKLFGYTNAPELYTYDGQNKYSINCLPLNNNSYNLTLGVQSGVSGDFILQFSDIENLLDMYYITLEDNKTGDVVEIVQGSQYSYSAEEGDNPDRFTLHFGVVGIDDQPTTPAIQAYVYGQQLQVLGNGGITQLDIFDVQGRLLSSETIHVVDGYSKTLNLQAGMYVVRLQNKEGVSSTKVIIK